jgi:hypothetical protein
MEHLFYGGEPEVTLLTPHGRDDPRAFLFWPRRLSAGRVSGRLDVDARGARR